MLSFWEKELWFKDIDLLIIGGGLVGLSTALFYREKNPEAKILVLEKGALPTGASTKNAGFACFGSPSEILDDLKIESENEVFNLVKQRYEGLQLLRTLLSDEELGFKNTGGYELFLEDDADTAHVLEKLPYLNKKLEPIFQQPAFVVDNEKLQEFQFSGFSACVAIPAEGMVHTGKMIFNLIQKALRNNIIILNGVSLESFEDLGNRVQFQTKFGIFLARKMAICTNGFARPLVPELNVEPARAQVLITNEISKLAFNGVFHFQMGYYYFRNVGGRVLFGGGRNLDKDNERTLQMETSAIIQKNLQKLLKKHILPAQAFQIEDSWAGIMGMGGNNEKEVIVRLLSSNVACAVRLGGMGIALGAAIGKKTASLWD
ncbi:MAG: FAD-binding oxidoreductase [Schleiferiaceae bacterium]|nr:FAD-binding oxidoreductase [Schleiferiaceae bacterium]